MPVALPTREDYFRVGAHEVLARSATRPRATRISPEAVYTDGTDINIILATESAMADEATRHLAIRMAALFLDSAEGEDLDRLVADRFSPTVARKQAAPALVTLTFTRNGPPSPLLAVTLATGTKARTPTGTEYELVQPTAFSAGSTGPITAVAQAVLSGTGGNVAEDTIVELLNFGSPADTAIQVSNEDPASGGTDVETDESLRERARDFYRTARRGILAAIEFGALTVDGVVSATAEELLGAGGLPNGIVRVYVADEHGRSNAVLAAAVTAALREYRAAGIIVDVLTTQPQFETISYSIGFRSGTDTRAAVDQLRAITVATVNLLAPQEPLQRSLLFSLARSISGAIVGEGAIMEPAGDVYPTDPGVIKTSLDRVKVNGL